MTVDEITSVVIIKRAGITVFQVTLTNTTTCFVPNDPNNSDYPIVQEWLAQHPSA